MDSAWLLWSSLFSLLGTAILVYGWRQHKAAPTLIGVALSIYSYFISSALLVVVVGVALLGLLVVGSRWEND